MANIYAAFFSSLAPLVFYHGDTCMLLCTPFLPLPPRAVLLERPGCYVFLGGAGGPSSCMVHHPKYDFNDAILPIGSSWFAEVVESRMPLLEAEKT